LIVPSHQIHLLPCPLLIFVLASVSLFSNYAHQIAVKQVLVELKPLLSDEKLLVSIAAGIKMKDLQVSICFSKPSRVNQLD
jgi:hypothetical protein